MRKLLAALNHFLVAVLLLLVASFWLGKPVWNAGKPELLLLVMFAAAYLGAALATGLARPAGAGRAVLQALTFGAASFGLACIALEFANWRWPDTFEDALPGALPLWFVAAGLPALVLLTLLQRLVGVRGLALVVAAIGAGAIATASGLATRTVGANLREVAHIDSSLYVLEATTYRRWFTDRARGGAIAAFGEGYLVAAGAGTIYYVAEAGAGKSLEIRDLGYRVPFNPQAFSAAGRAAFGKDWTDHYHRERLRVADLLLQSRPDRAWRVFVSHHFWKEDAGCYVVRVSAIEGPESELLAGDGSLAWRTVYESSPCLKFNTDGHRGGWFAGYQIGGAMALLGDDALLVAVGDHEYDGWNRNPILPQDQTSPYGKIHRVPIDGGASEVWSLGHRNPQGLYVDRAGAVWSTEHGPRGGDELNLIRQSANYGWPLATYGTEYFLNHWPVGTDPGHHAGFEPPVTAFVPSIALSALTGIAGERFANWRGDLLLTSLSGELRRVRINSGRAVVSEPIVIGGRIRDLAQGHDGRVALWTDTQDLVFLQPADESSPQALKMQCAACHTFSRKESASIGPNLWEVVGRRVGADEKFEYSEPMRRFGGRWTRERLDAFLADPAGTVPGTSMQFDGIKDAAKRKRLIDFLEELE